MTNRLAAEKSPYLLQHAENPVDWYPWGTEAFNRAHEQDKPVFLSSGYSTCHWCHVMARESFEDPDTAQMLNDAFICIKIDREELPHIDALYMTVAQMLTGGGGWPLTIIMTPDKKPFFAATYIPKTTRFGHVGLHKLIPKITELWKSRRSDILDNADKIIHTAERFENSEPSGQVDKTLISTAVETLKASFDETHGGFGSAPKFPSPHMLTFLLEHRHRTGDDEALRMVEQTLQHMDSGGIHDHVGGGFHRYATDPGWILPHFEKMLYDQALLGIAFCDTFQATGNSRYADTAADIFSYVLRDMLSPRGAFYAAEDAESEGEEGLFYLWSLDEIERLLTEDESAVVCSLYGITREGNMPDQPSGSAAGKNILYRSVSVEDVSSKLNMDPETVEQKAHSGLCKLFEHRQTRIRPHCDDKILCDWNGLMIASLAKGGRVLNKPAFAHAAEKAAHFIMSHLSNPEQGLRHRYRDTEAAIPAFADDYVMLIWGFIELYETTFNAGYLQAAVEMQKELDEGFLDRESGGYFTAHRAESTVPVRQKQSHDGAVPSANSVAMMNLVRLARLTGNSEYESRASHICGLFAGRVRQSPTAHTLFLSVAAYMRETSCSVVIAGRTDADDTHAMIEALNKTYHPGTDIVLRPTDSDDPPITRIAPQTRSRMCLNGSATAYVCCNYTCGTPTTDIQEMISRINAAKA